MKDWEKYTFFFLSGAYSIYAWNSILNLNGYFQTQYQDVDLPKEYSVVNMSCGAFAIFVSYLVAKYFQHLMVARNAFISIFVLFHLMYVNTELVHSKDF